MFKTGFRKKEEKLDTSLCSNLLPLLFERLAVNKRLVILDVGPASPATVKFFTQFKCRLNFVDLYTEDVVLNAEDDATHEELVEQFHSALNLPDETAIDLCLFWDFFNYLDGQALMAFIEALAPYIGNDTRGYALGVLNARTSLPNYQYGIEGRGRLSQSPNKQEQMQVFPHSQRDLKQLLDYFTIDKSRLISDGRVEYVLFKSSHRGVSKEPIFGL